MKNKIVILISLFLFSACSNFRNIRTQDKNVYFLEKEMEINKKIELDNFIENFKQKLKFNNFIELRSFFGNSLRNRKILSEIENIDFSQIKIVNTKPKLHKNTASNILAFIFMDEVKYFRFTYTFKKGKWEITKIKDGR